MDWNLRVLISLSERGKNMTFYSNIKYRRLTSNAGGSIYCEQFSRAYTAHSCRKSSEQVVGTRSYSNKSAISSSQALPSNSNILKYMYLDTVGEHPWLHAYNLVIFRIYSFMLLRSTMYKWVSPTQQQQQNTETDWTTDRLTHILKGEKNLFLRK